MIKLYIDNELIGLFRALCDSGAIPNLMKNNVMKYRSSKTVNINGGVNGISNEPVRIRKKVNAMIQPWFENGNEKKISAEFWVLPKSCKWAPILPNRDVTCDVIVQKLPPNIADPTFWRADHISILLGIEVWAEIMEGRSEKLSEKLVSQESMLGNLISGRIGDKEMSDLEKQSFERNVCTVSINDLDDLLKKFWSFEDLPLCVQKSPEHELVEQMYERSHYREKDGRFVVAIPMKPTVSELGSSRERAKRRFYQIEARMERDGEFKAKYIEFMREYEQLGHMVEAKNSPLPGEMVYYLAHHGVMSSEKFRVVFDGSCKTDKDISLNSAQFVGPKLQMDLIEIIMRFRRHRYAVSADIKKMYRQVKIVPEQWNLQRIFWRENRNQPLKEYCLVVVTYGLSSSSYLSVKSMQTGARAMYEQYPKAVEAIVNDFYMDDGLTGAETEEQAITLAKDMRTVLAGSQFPLCKWRSNSDNLLKELSEQATESVILTEQGPTSVLGLKWITKTDEFTYVVSCANIDDTITKRKILSRIGQLFDPAGFITPVLVKAKMLVQSIWKEQCGWDHPVPDHIKEQWIKLWETINELEKIRVPRWIRATKIAKIQLHGFADSSSFIGIKIKGSPDKKGNHSEIRAGGGGTFELFVTVRKAMGLEGAEHYFWSDSTIALQWINRPVHELKLFVANRVKRIQEVTSVQNWYHVRTTDNPADLISRGISVKEIIKNELWWHGPAWLREKQENWPKPLDFRAITMPPECNIELKVHSISVQRNDLQIGSKTPSGVKIVKLINYTNNLSKLLRITSYVMRYCKRLREKKLCKPKFIINLEQIKELVELPGQEELARALCYFVKKEQEVSYGKERKVLSEHSNSNEIEKSINCPDGSTLLALRPFMDKEQILRVGGRLGNAEIPYDMKYPIIIPNGSRLSALIIEKTHQETLHGSVQLMTQVIRRNFWIPKLRNELRAYIHKCVTCARYNKSFETQLMADLPKERINQNRAFLHTGVDYAGPLEIAERYKSRTNKRKCWIAIFVCMVTRAVHIDAVTELSSAAFIACYERFIARRGHCNRMFSDNGTAFIGANKELKIAFKHWITPDSIEHLNKKGTEWKFMVPAAPHQGGIYEAAVKSMKYHLKRILGAKCYSYEYLITFLSKIEAVLNSRPLYALSDNPTDYSALTPGHFLIQESFILPPPISAPAQTSTSLKRIFEEQSNMLNHFWKRWHNEYLAHLLPRKKWRQEREPIKVGQLVVVKDENLPPARWLLGRIIELIPSRDNLVRSVVIKTQKNNKLTRAVQKLCILPIASDEEQHTSEKQ
ncbi:uncharacterized protein LOC116351048 [Contarinia nasturtii]|uniref:uncharacterized protein LOC116351048 n=1 Tax=Contarinia nasturtii TaxID=265458 RepID=UPI0012D4C106|nr:uncharacterized protein LOC116351048 [Contarinia nasturtii]